VLKNYWAVNQNYEYKYSKPHNQNKIPAEKVSTAFIVKINYRIQLTIHTRIVYKGNIATKGKNYTY
jgi:hypothetical protein